MKTFDPPTRVQRDIPITVRHITAVHREPALIPVDIQMRKSELEYRNPGFTCNSCGQGFDFPCRCD